MKPIGKQIVQNLTPSGPILAKTNSEVISAYLDEAYQKSQNEDINEEVEAENEIGDTCPDQNYFDGEEIKQEIMVSNLLPRKDSR